MVSVCISLMTDDIEHLCMCLLTVCVYSVEKCLFGPFAHCELACPSVVELYFCRVAPHQIHDLQIFCHIQWVVFSYSCSPLKHTVLVLMRSNLWFFSGVFCAFGTISNKPLPDFEVLKIDVCFVLRGLHLALDML